MPLTLGQALFFLKGDSQHLDRSMQQAERSVAGSVARIGEATGRIKGFLGRAFEFAAGGFIVKGVEGITRALEGIGGGAYQAVADTERLKMSLEALVAQEEVRSGRAKDMTEALAGAGVKAEELLAWTQKLAIQSPFSQAGVADAFRMAKAYGFTAEESKRLTTALIDFAAASGQDEYTMQRIALALGQIKAKGKLAGDEILQLTEAGLGVRDILAREFNVTTAELVRMQEKGLIPADKAIEALTRSLEKDFGGAAARQATSLAGLTASLQDLSQISLRNALEGTFRAFQPAISSLVDLLGNPVLQGGLKRLGDGFGKSLAGGVQKFLDVFAGFNRVFQVIPRSAEELTTFVTGMTDAKTATDTLAASLRVERYWQLVQAFTSLSTVVRLFLPGLRELGTGLQAAFQAVGNAVRGVLRGISGEVQQALGPLAKMGEVIDLSKLAAKFTEAMRLFRAVFQLLNKEAFSWGEGIGKQLGAGIGRAAVFVVASLRSLGGIIRSWLAPHSPPKITPDLDKWGTQAAEIYMAGWGQANMGVFNELGGMIQGALQEMVAGGALKQTDVIPTLLGSREAIGAAVNELRSVGRVSDETFERIISGAGPAGAGIRNVTRAYIDYLNTGQEVAAAEQEVAAATDELTRLREELGRVTDEYNAKLEPYNAKLDDIQRRKQAIQDKERLAELDAQAADSALTESERELAKLDAEAIRTKQQIDAIEEESQATQDAKQAELDAAEQRQLAAEGHLSAAQEAQAAAERQLEVEQTAIDALREHNALLREQRELLKPKGGGAGAGAGAGPPPTDKPPAVKDVVAEVAGAAGEAIQQEVSDTILMAQAEAERKLREAEATLRTKARTFLDGIKEGITAFPAWVKAEVPGMFQGALSTVSTVISGFLGELGASLTTQAGSAEDAGDDLTDALLPKPAQMARAAGEWAGEFIQSIYTSIPAALDRSRKAVFPFLETLLPDAERTRTAMGGLVASMITAIGMYAPAIIHAAGAWTLALLSFAVDAAPGVLKNMAAISSRVIAAIGGALPGIITALGWWVTNLADFAVRAAPGLLANLGAAIGQVLDAIGNALPGIVEALARWAAEFIEWAIDAAPRLMEQLIDLARKLQDWLIERIPIIAGQLGNWALEFVKWVGPASGKLLVALLEMLGKLIAWAGESSGKVFHVFSTEWAPKLGEWVGRAIPLLIAALGSFLRELITWAGEKASYVAQNYKQIGTSVIDGIKQGIKDAWEGLKGFFMGLMKGLIAGGKEAVEAKSPSRAAYREIGEPVMLGILNAMKAYQETLYQQMRTITDRMLEAAQDLGARIKAALQQSLEAGLAGDVSIQRKAIDNFRQLQDLLDVDAMGTVDATEQGQAWLDRIKELEQAQGAVEKELETLDTARADIEEAYKPLSQADLDALFVPGSMPEEQRQAKIREFLDAYAAERQAELDELTSQRDALVAQQQANTDQQAEIERARQDAAKAYSGAAAGVAAQARADFAALREQVAALRKEDAGMAQRLYDLRSGHITELAELERDLALEQDADRRAALAEEIAMTKEAQAAEMAQYDYELAQARQKTAELQKSLEGVKDAAEQSQMDLELERIAKEREALAAKRKQAEDDLREKDLVRELVELDNKKAELDRALSNTVRGRQMTIDANEWSEREQLKFVESMRQLQADLDKTVADIATKTIEQRELALAKREAALQSSQPVTSSTTTAPIEDLAAMLRQLLGSAVQGGGATTNYYYQPTYGRGPDNPAAALEILRLLNA